MFIYLTKKVIKKIGLKLKLNNMLKINFFNRTTWKIETQQLFNENNITIVLSRIEDCVRKDVNS